MYRDFNIVQNCGKQKLSLDQWSPPQYSILHSAWRFGFFSEICVFPSFSVSCFATFCDPQPPPCTFVTYPFGSETQTKVLLPSAILTSRRRLNSVKQSRNFILWLRNGEGWALNSNFFLTGKEPSVLTGCGGEWLHLLGMRSNSSVALGIFAHNSFHTWCPFTILVFVLSPLHFVERNPFQFL